MESHNKLRENEERTRNWSEIEEIERKWRENKELERERFSLSISSFSSHFPSIYGIFCERRKNLNIRIYMRK